MKKRKTKVPTLNRISKVNAMMSIGLASYVVSNFEKNRNRNKAKKNIGKDHNIKSRLRLSRYLYSVTLEVL